MMAPSLLPSTSQTRYPARTVIRTVFQLVVGIAAAMPFLVDASGLPETSAVVAGALTVSAAITRIMASPVVNAFLPSWLRAEPPVPQTPGPYAVPDIDTPQEG